MEQSQETQRWGIFGAVVAAIGASLCCTIPLVLVSIGVGGAWLSALTALAPYRVLFVGLAVGLLGFAFGKRHVHSGPNCACDPVTERRTSVLLGIGALATVGLIVAPFFLGQPTNVAATALTQLEEGRTAHLVLDVEAMTCPSCSITIERALDRIAGVESVEFTYEPPRVFVAYDPTAVSIGELVEAVNQSGYEAVPAPV